MKPQSTPWISYRELIRAVGIDPELNPSSWRKSIDHSAETVVFFQVDLRGALPRMSKSVRVCRDQLSGEDKQGRLIPTVFVDETQLSSDYVKAVIGRRFLSDEDDLMKLLEHVGVLRPDEEAGEGQENDGRDNVYQEDETENISYLPQPEPKRARFAGRTDFGQRIERIAANRSHTGTGSHQTESAGSAYRTPSDLPPYPRSATAATDHLPTGVADEKAAEVTDADVEMGGSAVEDDDDNFPLPEYVQHDVPGSSAHHNDEEHLESGLEDENDVEDATDETPGEEGTGEAELFTHQETTVLIDNVKAHPVLWRKQNQSGSTTDRTRQQQLAWEKVTAAVSRATVAGKPKKTSQQCSRKWGSLHAYFRMILPTTKEDEALRNRWPFTQQMMFTKSEDKMRKRHGNSLENR
ncbi:uncharacterized protein LOC129585497 [Paramacrobiotus metropolitanus]|uniref:uncharacterized protein LOC129585497 n=1 Tax=Paramacrobiotus metropolitanus TaxID=2943436 RepID=UPI0024456BBB|nr:uncharacterized protein LOC129585497 [Paramacrobiotus metropolitanus]